jgi:anti-sigma factor RsiW
MQDEAHVFDLLPGYALDCLDGDDAAQVTSHLATCHLCRVELEALRDVVETLSLPAVEPPPADAKRRLMARIDGLTAEAPAPRPRPATRPAPIWAIAAVVVIAALGVGNVLLLRQVNNHQQFTGPTGMRAIALASEPAASPGGSGFVIISSDGHSGVIVVDALPQLKTDQQYQVWLLHDGEITRGPAFTVDDTGYKGAWIKAPQPLDWYTDILLTIEPAEGSPDDASGARVLSGPLHVK